MPGSRRTEGGGWSQEVPGGRAVTVRFILQGEVHKRRYRQIKIHVFQIVLTLRNIDCVPFGFFSVCARPRRSVTWYCMRLRQRILRPAALRISACVPCSSTSFLGDPLLGVLRAMVAPQRAGEAVEAVCSERITSPAAERTCDTFVRSPQKRFSDGGSIADMVGPFPLAPLSNPPKLPTSAVPCRRASRNADLAPPSVPSIHPPKVNRLPCSLTLPTPLTEEEDRGREYTHSSRSGGGAVVPDTHHGTISRYRHCCNEGVKGEQYRGCEGRWYVAGGYSCRRSSALPHQRRDEGVDTGILYQPKYNDQACTALCDCGKDDIRAS